MGFRFRLTFSHSSAGFFHFREQSIPVELGDGAEFSLTARNASTLMDATSFHIEGRGFADENYAITTGERLRLRLRVLNSLLDLGMKIPAADARQDKLADAVKDNISRESGAVVIDTIRGLAVFTDDPNQVELVPSGTVSTYPSEPAYVLKALAVLWPLDMHLDERADDALRMLSISTTESSARARFLTTYVALERMVVRPSRSVAARGLLNDFKKQVAKSRLSTPEKHSLKTSLGGLKQESLLTALDKLLARITPSPVILGTPAKDYLLECKRVRNRIAHNDKLDDGTDLVTLSKGLRDFILTLIWTMNKIPSFSVNVTPTTLQPESFELRML
jgi:hypothetical protein